MASAFTLLVLVVVLALVFDYINGFHDTANAVATVVSTNVLPGRTAVLLAALFNFGGAFDSVGVAKTIGHDIAKPDGITQTVVAAALLGAIGWNLLTWYYGIPSSSSHALIGGLIGAALASAHGSWDVVIWSSGSGHWWQKGGLLNKVIIPMITSPICGLILGFSLMALLYT